MNSKYIDRNDTLISRYFKDISRYKLLDSNETKDLIIKAQNGDINARNKVVCANLRFVVRTAKKFQNKGIPLIDLISSGTEGLIKAIDKFDVTKENTFLTYAVWWIRQAIYSSIYWQAKEIRLPVSQQLLVIKIIDATNKFIKANGRNPNSVELHNMTGIDISDIDYLSQFFNKLVSVDDFIGGDEEHSQVGDIIPDKDIAVDEEVNKKILHEELLKYIDTLGIRERDIMCLYYGFGVPATDPIVIGNMFGIGRERVRQIKEAAIAKLKKRVKLQLNKFI